MGDLEEQGADPRPWPALALGARGGRAIAGRGMAARGGPAGGAGEPLLTASWLPEIDRLVVATFVEMSEGVQSAPWEAVAAEEWFPTEGLERNAQPRGGYRSLIDYVAHGLDIRQD